MGHCTGGEHPRSQSGCPRSTSAGEASRPSLGAERGSFHQRFHLSPLTEAVGLRMARGGTVVLHAQKSRQHRPQLQNTGALSKVMSDGEKKCVAYSLTSF